MPCSVPSSSQLPRSNWTERLTAPFKFGAQELVPSAVKLGSAVTLTAVMRRAAGQLGRQLLGHHMRYQVGVGDAGLGTGIAKPESWQLRVAVVHAACMSVGTTSLAGGCSCAMVPACGQMQTAMAWALCLC